MGDVEPLYILRSTGFCARTRETARLRDGEASNPAEHISHGVCGVSCFTELLELSQQYPLLIGSQPNTFKAFMALAMNLVSGGGVFSYVHDDGIYNDPNGGALRQALYPRLRLLLQFENELNLFQGLNDHGRLRFEVSVGGAQRSPRFYAMSDVFWPTTVDESFVHEGAGRVEGRKNGEGEWNRAGHRDRLLEIDELILELFARVYDPPGTPTLRVRLPQLQAREFVPVMKKLRDTKPA